MAAVGELPERDVALQSVELPFGDLHPGVGNLRILGPDDPVQRRCQQVLEPLRRDGLVLLPGPGRQIPEHRAARAGGHACEEIGIEAGELERPVPAHRRSVEEDSVRIDRVGGDDVGHRVEDVMEPGHRQTPAPASGRRAQQEGDAVALHLG